MVHMCVSVHTSLSVNFRMYSDTFFCPVLPTEQARELQDSFPHTWPHGRWVVGV